MAIQSSADIGKVIRDAVAFNIRNWTTGGKINTDSLLQSVQDLFKLLENRKIQYVLVGGIATLLHDFQPDIPSLLKELSRYLDKNDLGEVDKILGELQKRIERFKRDARSLNE